MGSGGHALWLPAGFPGREGGVKVGARAPRRARDAPGTRGKPAGCSPRGPLRGVFRGLIPAPGPGAKPPASQPRPPGLRPSPSWPPARRAASRKASALRPVRPARCPSVPLSGPPAGCAQGAGSDPALGCLSSARPLSSLGRGAASQRVQLSRWLAGEGRARLCGRQTAGGGGEARPALRTDAGGQRSAGGRSPRVCWCCGREPAGDAWQVTGQPRRAPAGRARGGRTPG